LPTKKKAKKGRRVKEVEFELEEGQRVFVHTALLGPGLGRVVVSREKGKITVWADANSGSHFRFKKGGSGKPGNPNFEINNLDSGEAIEDILQQKFWGQFNWGQLFAYQKPEFQRKIKKAIKKLVSDFEAKSAKKLNAITKPSPKKEKGKVKK